MPTKLENAPDTFFDDASMHFGLAMGSVLEKNRDFLDLESGAPGFVFHFDLEGIADKSDLVEVQLLQYVSAVAHESGRGVFDRHTGDEPGIERCAF